WAGGGGRRRWEVGAGNDRTCLESHLGGQRSDELALEVVFDRLDGVRLARGFVSADANYAGEAQCHSRFILGTALDIVVPHLDDNLGTYPDRTVCFADLEREQALGHLAELFVGQSFA